MGRTSSYLRRRVLVSALVGGALVASLIATALPVAAEDDGDALLPVPHEKLSALDPISVDGFGVGAVGTRNSAACSTETSADANVNTDCGPAAPHNETSIAVNPTDPLNIIGGANDYQLSLTRGGTVYETIYSRAHVSTDGGQTWTDYPLAKQNPYAATGDPAVAFDADGRAYYATLGFTWSQNRFCCTNPDVVVSTSTDGGATWSDLKRVATGTGSFGSPGTFNDKEYIAAWGSGNAIVTWTQYNDGIGGSYISSPIYASVTHDGGATWSRKRQISGSSDDFCQNLSGTTNECNVSTFSTPAVASDGKIYVSFVNYSGDADGRDQYLVVRVNPSTGALADGPWSVDTVYDGFIDYPISEAGRQTLQDSQFRTNPSGNLSADPLDAEHLALVWSDNRNNPDALDPFSDPYDVVTNSDVIVAESWDGGQTWDSEALTRTNDQFQPWSAYDADGNLRIGTFDRHYDGDNHMYGYSLWTQGSGWSQLTTALSDPTQGDRWFSGVSPDPDFEHPSSFIGDYSGIATWSDGTDVGVVALWTDMRVDTFFPNRSGWGENAFFAAAP